MKISIEDLTELPAKSLTVYLKQIASWYKAEWGIYRPERADLESWKITQLTPQQFPITLVALELRDKHFNLAGVIRLKHDDIEGLFPGEKKYRISGLYVNSDYRGKGIGSQLLRHALSCAGKQGAQKVWLFTHSKQAKNYYLKYGWEFKCTQKVHGALAAVMYIRL